MGRMTIIIDTIETVDTIDTLDVIDQHVRVLASRDDTSGAFEMFEITGPEGSGPPPHAHPWTETFLVLDGQVVVQVDGDDRLLSSGESATVPYMTTHTFMLVSASARVLSVTDGVSAGRFFEDLHTNAHVGAVTPDNIGIVVEVAKRNGLTSPLF
jgi:quercetin dioxygenase-like cupin family protein